MSNKDTSLQTSPQLEIDEQSGGVVALTNKQILSIYKKSEQSGIPFDTLMEVYERGYLLELTEQAGFNRVNSFIAGGAAREMDNDLYEKRGLWDNIHAKRERIKHGSGEHMRKPGSKGAPTAAALKASQTEEHLDELSPELVGKVNKARLEKPSKTTAAAQTLNTAVKKAWLKSKVGKVEEDYTGAETVSTNSDDPSSRFVGTTSLTDVYKKDTPGQSTLKTIKKVVKESWQDKKYKNPEGGLTKAGVNAYRREHPGSKLKTAVTTEPSKLKKGSKAANRRKSFCARMGGMKKRLTSAETARDPDSRINKALRKWHC